MGEVVFVEVLGRFGSVLQRVRVSTFPATIGRSYRCDVIVEDPWVAPIHSVIERSDDGTLRLRNAVEQTLVPPTVGVIDPRHGLAATVGTTSIRLRTPDFELTPTRTHPLPRVGSSLFGSLSSQVALATVLLVMLGTHSFLSSTEAFLRSSEANDLQGTLAVLLIWCSGWSFATRVTANRFSFLPHLLAALSCVLFADAIAALLEYVDFLWISVRSQNWQWLVTGAVLGVFITAHLWVLGTLQWRSILTASALGWILLSASMLAFGQVHTQSTALPGVMVKPVPTRLLPATSMEAFFASATSSAATSPRTDGR